MRMKRKQFVAMIISVAVGITSIPAVSVSAEAGNGIKETTEQDIETLTQTVYQGWVLDTGNWYYYEAGQKVTGWKLVGSNYYYMYEDGKMAANTWIGSYYVNADGAWVTGRWILDNWGWWYQNEDGSYPFKSWKLINGSWYYFNQSGYMVTGCQYINGAWYWLDSSGAMVTGWQYINGQWYYMEPDGNMITGWKRLEDTWYYLNDSGAMVTGRNDINGTRYYFDQWGAMAEVDISSVIQNALKPVGKTLYVWGGGWNVTDNGSGETTLYEGVWPQWEQYFWNNKNNYSYRPGQIAWENGNRDYRFWGLDCSGYIGWTVYNSVQKGRSTGGYVTASTKIADSLAWYGFGNAVSCTPNSAFYPGDIVSIKGHCFLCLGQCQDGSVLILHSTPNGGVQMSGTVKGGSSSLASRLAQEFMQEYYPDWCSCFGKEGRQSVNASDYLYGTKFSWQNAGAVYDAQGLKGKTAEQILNYIKVNW